MYSLSEYDRIIAYINNVPMACLSVKICYNSPISLIL